MRAYVGDLFGDRHAARALAFSERLPAPGDDVALDEPALGDLMLRGTGRTVLLSGRVRVDAGLVCGACLRPFHQTFDVPVDEEFGRSAAADPRGERELGPDDFLTPVAPGDMIDVTEVIRQHVVLALPIAPRCSPDCRGLCPGCGADLNAGPCRCAALEPKLPAAPRGDARDAGAATSRPSAPPRPAQPDDTDPRLDALRRWRSPAERIPRPS